MYYNEKESYKHKLAKELLHKWLSDGWKENDAWYTFPLIIIPEWNKKSQGYPISARSDFVQMETPLIKDGSQLLDEIYCRCTNNFRKPIGYSPCKECKKKPLSKIAAVADIAIEHKGNIAYIFEIVHKNDLSDKKIEFYISDSLWTIFVIKADHILGQIQKPDILYASAIIDGGRYYTSPCVFDTFNK